MSLQIIKQLAVTEDIEWGVGTVVQPRDVSGDGVPTDETFNQVSSASMPHLQLDDTTVSDVRTELNDKYSKAESDAKFARINGDEVEVFSVADPSINSHAVNKGYLESYMAGQLADYALKTEVLTKTNLIAYSPTSDYHPATKKYIDDLVISAGAGDMLKSVYDSLDNGVVNEARLIDGVGINDIMHNRGPVTDADNVADTGVWEGSDIANVPEAGKGLLRSYLGATQSIVVQMYHGIDSGNIFSRRSNNAVWTTWEAIDDKTTVVDNLASTSTTDALSANQGRILSESITQVSATNVPVNGIIMYSGALSSIPNNWALCDGSNGTPNLVDKFVRGTASQAYIGNTGGTDSATMPSHAHKGPAHSHNAAHTHSAGTGNDGGHQHSMTTKLDGAKGTDNITVNNEPGATWVDNLITYEGIHSHSVTVNEANFNTSTSGTQWTSSAGGSGDNKPAYYTLAYIIRVS